MKRVNHQKRNLRMAPALLAAASLLALPLNLAYADPQPSTVDLAADTPERLPGQHPDPSSLEGGMWSQMARAEKEARTSGERDFDPKLNAYVASVIKKIDGPFAPDIRAYVLDRPFFNASMGPNGFTEVWSGLLLRCETEDQLAFVLGHESGHFRHNHSLKAYENYKGTQGTILAASVVISVAGTAAGAQATSYGAWRSIYALTNGLIDIVYLGAVASYFGFSRETETMADAYGLIYMRSAGYDGREAERLWTQRLGETQASDNDIVRHAPTRINIFGDHPLEPQRVVDLQARNLKMDATGAIKRDEAAQKAARAAYRDEIRQHLKAWIVDDLRRADYGQTLYVLDCLSRDGLDAGLLSFYRGEALRLRGKDADYTQAIAAFETALKAPDAPVETRRQMGEVYRHLGQTQKAIAAYKAYKQAAPDAEDAALIDDMIAGLKAAPGTPPASTPEAPKS